MMPRSGILAAIVLLIGGLVTAPPPRADSAMLAAADPSRVTPKLLRTCAKCHYETGISDDPEIPHLAAQRPSYLYKQLQDFRAGARDGGLMNKFARRLSDPEMADLAVLFGGRPLPAEPGVEPLPAPPLVTAGDTSRGIESCASCHGDDGRGMQDTHDAPALAGMPLSYFEMMMVAFRDGERANDADGVMRTSARGLSDDEIRLLARYYLALGGRQPLPE
jgi:cytochrome c553